MAYTRASALPANCLSSPKTDALEINPLVCLVRPAKVMGREDEDLTLGLLCFEGRSCIVIEFVPTVSGTMPDC